MPRQFRFSACAEVRFTVEASTEAEAKEKAAALIEGADACGYEVDVDEQHEGLAYIDPTSAPSLLYVEGEV